MLRVPSAKCTLGARAGAFMVLLRDIHAATVPLRTAPTPEMCDASANLCSRYATRLLAITVLVRRAQTAAVAPLLQGDCRLATKLLQVNNNSARDYPDRRIL